jgi:hypothetical protein
MKPKIMDDWYWFLMCYWMVLFQPLRYAREVHTIRKNREKEKWWEVRKP